MEAHPFLEDSGMDGADQTRSGARPPKPFSMQVREEGGTSFIVLAGELDLAHSDRLDSAIRKTESDGAARIVVDMEDLTFLDSMALSMILGAIRRQEGQRRLQFIPSKHDAVQRILSLTNTEDLCF
jgi:anti-anti-sigma factor